MRSTRALRTALLGALLTASLAALAAGASAATVHFERESVPALKAQLARHEVHALTFHPAPAPGHIHVSMNDGRHYTVVYTAGEQARLIALGTADGARYAVATVKPKPAATHHTLRYIAAGILIVVIVVVAAVLLVDRRRKLREQDPSTTPASS